MRLSLVYSGAVHALLFLLLICCIHPSAQKTKATYTIDFIGSASQPMRYGPQEEAAPAPKPEPAKTESEIKAPKAQPKPAPKKAAKPAKPKYNSEEQISKKAKKEAKPAPKEEPKQEEKVVLSKPSILGDVSSSNISAEDLHTLAAAEPGVKAVRANFTNFPYPWYITQVRNSLWREWRQRMPKSKLLSTLISFNIDKYGVIYAVQIEKSSGNDDYDYAATSAVNNSGPYQPLPKGFGKDILTVTVEFKNEE